MHTRVESTGNRVDKGVAKTGKIVDTRLDKTGARRTRSCTARRAMAASVGREGVSEVLGFFSHGTFTSTHTLIRVQGLK